MLLIYSGAILYVNINDSNIRKNISDNVINAVIIDKKIGGKKYTTDSNFVFILPHHDSIEIGDSISKKK